MPIEALRKMLTNSFPNLKVGIGRYRYQILDTIDIRVLKKSIDTGKKYRCFDISAPAIFFHFGQRHRHENRIPKSLSRRKYYKSSSFSMVLNGPREGWEFLVMLVAITDIYFSMFTLSASFCCYGCSSWENIDIGIDIDKKRQISSKYRIE